MYSRFWNMFLYDLGCVCEPEPFRKLVNQGMIQDEPQREYQPREQALQPGRFGRPGNPEPRHQREESAHGDVCAGQEFLEKQQSASKCRTKKNMEKDIVLVL